MSTEVQDVLKRRAWAVVRRLGNAVGVLPKTFVIAGGCMSDWNYNDIDIFASEYKPGQSALITGDVVAESPNATTIRRPDGLIVQLCKYWKPTLQSLVDSFDFTLIQCGATITDGAPVEVYCTPAFLQDSALNVLQFSGSEFPLASLFRCKKYATRLNMRQGAYARSMIDIMVAVLKRGFDGYSDFKKQLDAVDLMFLPEDLDEVERGSLLELFELLNKPPGKELPADSA